MVNGGIEYGKGILIYLLLYNNKYINFRKISVF